MKILVICQYYYPEPFRISDICEELVKRGHEVTVITGVPNYPMGEIYDGYGRGEKRNETINGVDVRRCFTIARKTGNFYRFLNYLSYAISSSRYAAKLKDEYDVVFVNQLSPVMMANAGIKYKKKRRKKMILYCLDLWPESLTAGGIKRGSRVYKVFHKLSEKIYKSADKILVTSKSFKKYFSDEFGIEDVEYLPQYAEAIFTPEACCKKPNDTIDFMFAGNVGTVQSVKTIIEAANLTKDNPNLRWHIVGDGSELENVKKLSDEYALTSVYFHGRQPVEEMPKYYAAADAMIATMKKDEALSMTLPGKVQTYMAAGKPIIAAIDGETQFVINEAKCGLCGNAEDAETLACNARIFAESKGEEINYSENARKYYLSNYTKDMFMNILDDLFKEMR